MRKAYVITGANSGLGLEATRQLIALNVLMKNHSSSIPTSSTNNMVIYLLCRSTERAKAAMDNISPKDDTDGNNITANIIHVPFDAYDMDSIQKAAASILSNEHVISVDDNDDDDEVIAGILLNAGGHGDVTDATIQKVPNATGASAIAQLNLVAHATLVHLLASQGKIGRSRKGRKLTTRVVASGSEAPFFSPGFPFCLKGADFRAHLAGEVPPEAPAAGYCWMKGILALYWAAFARRYDDEEVYVLTVSPGAVPSTNLGHQGGSSFVNRFFTRLFCFFLGSNTVEEGAKIYVNALLGKGLFDSSNDSNQKTRIPSGSFYAHRKGLASDLGDVTELEKGSIFADQEGQDRVWDAVQSFLKQH